MTILLRKQILENIPGLWNTIAYEVKLLRVVPSTVLAPGNQHFPRQFLGTIWKTRQAKLTLNR